MPPPSLEQWDVIIIGGVSAALYASSQGINPPLITKDIGGQMVILQI
jgi:alkyl hydroperoxide reductase subunit AhpF